MALIGKCLIYLKVYQERDTQQIEGQNSAVVDKVIVTGAKY